MSSDLARQFYARFAGLARAHGRYTLPTGARANDKGKVEAPENQRVTVAQPLTVELWERHLAGTYGLGVVPIRDDATCVFGAIDVDVYSGLDLNKLSSECARIGFPLVVCRTKSGGAHLYLFTSAPVPAELVHRKLGEWAVALGYPGVEIFPKQTKLASERDFGNWINMPYHGGDRSLRYAVHGGASLKPDEFLKLAKRMAVSEAELEAIVTPQDDDDEMLTEGPPCLQVLAKRGFPEGTRNNAMFNLLVYLKKRYPEGWEGMAEEVNGRYMEPPLGAQEVTGLVRSLGKKTYGYKCKDQPIVQCCNRGVCLTRDFGVSGGSNDPGVVFGALVKLETDPPTWIWSVDGARLELDTEDLVDQKRFQKKCIDTLNKMPTMIKAKKWHEIITESLGKLEITAVPDDATRGGQLMVHLQRFCTGRVQGRSLDELLMGKPFTDPEVARTFFCSSDFLQYLQQHRVNGVSEKELYTWLRDHGVEHHRQKLKGKTTSYWSLPQFERQTEDFATPRIPKQEQM